MDSSGNSYSLYGRKQKMNLEEEKLKAWKRIKGLNSKIKGRNRAWELCRSAGERRMGLRRHLGGGELLG